ncbi:MAG: DnaJ domain-containing protein [Eggerthellaceae bacterium]|nr:DnaJ domain-containing protein [Eggerthellaceae bacterium]
MTEDPYDILGVSRDASPDEVKKAYRKKARENHPDLNPGDEQAAERMNKVNEAYDRITNPEKYAREDARRRAATYGAPYATGYRPGGPQQPGAGSYGSPRGGGPTGYQWVEVDWEDLQDFFNNVGFGGAAPTRIHPEASASDGPEVRRAIDAINASRYDEALTALKGVSRMKHDARWYYLMALASHGAGQLSPALGYIRRARQMDPGNADYAAAERSFTQRATAYQQQGQERGFSSSFIDPSNLCCCLCWGSMLCGPTLPAAVCCL